MEHEMNKNDSSNKTTIENAYKFTLKSTERKGILDLIKYLDENGFFKAPASTKHHQNWEGGLVQHSYSVYLNLSDLNKRLKLGFSQDSIIISALLHDICKYDCYIIHDDKTITWNKDAKPGHALKSIEIAEKFIELKEEEKEAIMYHMGAYEQKEYTWNDLSIAYKKNSLSYYIHVADMQDTYEFRK